MYPGKGPEPDPTPVTEESQPDVVAVVEELESQEASINEELEPQAPVTGELGSQGALATEGAEWEERRYPQRKRKTKFY